MIENTLNIEITAPFGNLYRDRTVAIGVKDAQGNILLGAKEGFYPPGISRLLGGGIDEGEAPDVAARRELSEELNLVTLDDTYTLEEVSKISISAVCPDNTEYNTEIWMYFVDIGDLQVKASDDVTSLVKTDLDGLKELADRYSALSETLWYKGKEGEFCWADYGKVYGKIHMIMWGYLAGRESPGRLI